MKKYLLLLILLLIAGVSKAEIQTSPLDKEMKSYISSKFKPAKNKKLVLYAEGATKVPNCPHSAAFAKIISKLHQRSDFLSAYSFQKFDINKMGRSSDEAAQKALAFHSLCGVFCIVSLQNNWIYAPLGHSFYQDQTAGLPDVLKNLKSKK